MKEEQDEETKVNTIIKVQEQPEKLTNNFKKQLKIAKKALKVKQMEQFQQRQTEKEAEQRKQQEE